MASILMVDDQWSLIIPSKKRLQPNPLGIKAASTGGEVAWRFTFNRSYIANRYIATLLLVGKSDQQDQVDEIMLKW